MKEVVERGCEGLKPREGEILSAVSYQPLQRGQAQMGVQERGKRKAPEQFPKKTWGMLRLAEREGDAGKKQQQRR